MAFKTFGGDALHSNRHGAHGDLTTAYQQSYAKYSGVVNGTQQAAAGVGLGHDVDTDFSTSTEAGPYDECSSDTGSNSSGYGKGIAGEFPMVQRSAGGDATSNSNETAGGKPVGL
jgi:hypothetical protein